MPISDLLRGSNAGSNIDYVSAIPREGLGSVFLNYAKEQEEAKAKAAQEAEKIRQFNVTTDTSNNRYEAEQARLAAKDAEDLRRYNLEKEQLKLDKEENQRRWDTTNNREEAKYKYDVGQDTIGTKATALAGSLDAATLGTDYAFGQLGAITAKAAEEKGYNAAYNKFAEEQISQGNLDAFNAKQASTDRSVLVKPMSQAEALTEVISDGKVTDRTRTLLGMSQASDEEVGKRLGELSGGKNQIYKPITDALYDEKKLNALVKDVTDNMQQSEYASLLGSTVKESGLLRGADTDTQRKVTNVLEDQTKNSGTDTPEQVKAQRDTAQQRLTNTLSMLTAFSQKVRDSSSKKGNTSLKLDSADAQAITDGTPEGIRGVVHKMVAGFSGGNIMKDADGDTFDAVANFFTGNKASDVKANMEEAFLELNNSKYANLTPDQKANIVRTASIASSAYGNADDKWFSSSNSIANITKNLADNAINGKGSTDEASMITQLKDNAQNAYNATLNQGGSSASSTLANYIDTGKQRLTPPPTITTPTQTPAVPRQQAVVNQTPVATPSSTAVVEQPTAPVTAIQPTDTKQVIQPNTGSTGTRLPVDNNPSVTDGTAGNLPKSYTDQMKLVDRIRTTEGEDREAAIAEYNSRYRMPAPTSSSNLTSSLPTNYGETSLDLQKSILPTYKKDITDNGSTTDYNNEAAVNATHELRDLYQTARMSGKEGEEARASLKEAIPRFIETYGVKATPEEVVKDLDKYNLTWATNNDKAEAIEYIGNAVVGSVAAPASLLGALGVGALSGGAIGTLASPYKKSNDGNFNINDTAHGAAEGAAAGLLPAVVLRGLEKAYSNEVVRGALSGGWKERETAGSAYNILIDNNLPKNVSDIVATDYARAGYGKPTDPTTLISAAELKQSMINPNTGKKDLSTYMPREVKDSLTESKAALSSAKTDLGNLTLAIKEGKQKEAELDKAIKIGENRFRRGGVFPEAEEKELARLKAEKAALSSMQTIREAGLKPAQAEINNAKVAQKAAVNSYKETEATIGAQLNKDYQELLSGKHLSNAAPARLALPPASIKVPPGGFSTPAGLASTSSGSNSAIATAVATTAPKSSLAPTVVPTPPPTPVTAAAPTVATTIPKTVLSVPGTVEDLTKLGAADVISIVNSGNKDSLLASLDAAIKSNIPEVDKKLLQEKRDAVANWTPSLDLDNLTALLDGAELVQSIGK
jgi:hypothetical protein